MTDRRQMCENAASRLQREAYEAQMRGRSTPLKHFTPCPRGLVYTAEIGNGNERPQILVTQEAALIYCQCHRDMTESMLIEYETPPKSVKTNSPA